MLLSSREPWGLESDSADGNGPGLGLAIKNGDVVLASALAEEVEAARDWRLFIRALYPPDQ